MYKFILLFVLSLSSVIYADDIKLNEALIEAARNGDLEEVTMLIKKEL